MAAGLSELSGMTGEARWASVAGVLLDTVLTAFADGNGGFYDTADDGERLIFRPADPTDNATPSGAFAAADALLSYGALTGDERYRDGGAAALAVLPPIAAQVPAGPAGWAWRWPRRCCPGPPRSPSSARSDDPRTADLLRAALHAAPPGAVFALGQGYGEARSLCSPAVRWSRGAPAAYVCRISPARRRPRPRRRSARRSAGPSVARLRRGTRMVPLRPWAAC